MNVNSLFRRRTESGRTPMAKQTQMLLVPLFAVLLTCAGMNGAIAAAPELTALYPAGIQRGQSIEVTVIGKVDRSAQLWSSRGDVQFAWHTDEAKKNVLQVIASADADLGLVWLRAYNAEGSSALRPFIVGNLPEFSEVEPNNQISEVTQDAAKAAVFNGQVERGVGVDMYRIGLKKGETVVAQVMANKELGSPMDSVLQLVSEGGFVLTQNHDGPDLDPKLTYTADRDGSYFVRIFAFPSAPNQSISLYGDDRNIYRLLLTKSPYIEQVFPAAVTLNQAMPVKLQGWNIPETLATTSVIGDALDAQVRIDLPEFSNFKEIPVVESPTVSEVEAADNSTQPTSLTLPVVVSGRIDKAGDEDVYQFQMTTGQVMEVAVESHALGTFMDARLKVLGPDQKALHDGDTRTAGVFDEKVTITAKADGLHTLHVADLFGHGGENYVYRLTIAPPKVDCLLTVKEGAYLLKPDAPLEIEVAIGRLNGYAKPVRVEAMGLPAGVTAEAVTSDPAADTKDKVKLVLKSAADQQAAQGSIQIVAHVEGEADRFAESTITGFSETTRQLWLTVLKAPDKPAEPKPEAEKTE